MLTSLGKCAASSFLNQRFSEQLAGGVWREGKVLTYFPPRFGQCTLKSGRLADNHLPSVPHPFVMHASMQRPTSFKVSYDDTPDPVAISLPAPNIVFYSEIRLQVDTGVADVICTLSFLNCLTTC